MLKYYQEILFTKYLLLHFFFLSLSLFFCISFLIFVSFAGVDDSLRIDFISLLHHQSVQSANIFVAPIL